MSLQLEQVVWQREQLEESGFGEKPKSQLQESGPGRVNRFASDLQLLHPLILKVAQVWQVTLQI